MWHACGCYWAVLSQLDVYRQRGVRGAAADYCQLREMQATWGANPEWKHSLYSGTFIYNRTLRVHTSSSTSTRTYWRVHGWLSRWRTVVIRASLMRLSWQSSTLFRIVPRPPRLATTSGFFSAAEHITQIKIILGYWWQKKIFWENLFIHCSASWSGTYGVLWLDFCARLTIIKVQKAACSSSSPKGRETEDLLKWSCYSKEDP